MTAARETTAPAPARWSAGQVIELFAGLGLPVCDDAEAIARRCRRRTRQWLRGCAALLHRRRELLQAVYARFAALADVAAAVEAAAGRPADAADLGERLRRIARRYCEVDDELAVRFAEEYLRQRQARTGV